MKLCFSLIHSLFLSCFNAVDLLKHVILIYDLLFLFLWLFNILCMCFWWLVQIAVILFPYSYIIVQANGDQFVMWQPSQNAKFYDKCSEHCWVCNTYKCEECSQNLCTVYHLHHLALNVADVHKVYSGFDGVIDCRIDCRIL